MGIKCLKGQLKTLQSHGHAINRMATRPYRFYWQLKTSSSTLYSLSEQYLIHADAKMFGIYLDKFNKRILEPSSDRNCNHNRKYIKQCQSKKTFSFRTL